MTRAIIACIFLLISGMVSAAPQPSVRVQPARDPIYGWNFNHIIRFRDSETGQFDNTIQVHTQSVLYTELSEQTLLAASDFVQLLKTHLGRMFRISESGGLHIWLCDNGQSGGQLSKDNLYIFNMGNERTSAQRCRELAHELGHSVLPGICGYTEPEPWANGYLGEQMLLRWLDASMKANQPQPQQYFGVTQKDISEMVTSRYESLLTAWRTGQYTETDLNRRDAVGMKALIGFIAYIQTVYGDDVLSESFRRIMAPNAQEMTKAFKRSVDDALPTELRILQTTKLYVPACRISINGQAEQLVKKPEWRKVVVMGAPISVKLDPTVRSK